MTTAENTPHQSLQEFFDTPAVMAAEFKLSPSASEPGSVDELLALEPESRERYLTAALDYPERYGPSAVTELIADKYPTIGAGGIQITSGIDEALGLIFTALVEPDDRVVLLTPNYPPQRQLPIWRGAKLVEWQARAENEWVPDLAELRELLSTPTKLLITTFPQNPTGFMPDAAYIGELLSIVEESGVLYLSDEIYDGLPRGRPPLVMAERSDKAITLHGLSKTSGLPGLRMGWLATRNRLAFERIREVKNLFNCYVPGPISVLAEIALRHEGELLARNEAIRAECLKSASDFFLKHGNLFAWKAPEAGVLAFPQWLGPGGAKDLSDRLVKEASISFAPSTCFNAGDRNFRLGLTRRNLGAALERLDGFLSSEL